MDSIQSRRKPSPDEDPDEWNEACLQYFKEQYRKRLKPQQPFRKHLDIPEDPSQCLYGLSPTLPPDDDILRNLLNDRLFYLALFCARYGAWQSDSAYEYFLWEMLGTHPGSLLELYCTAQMRRHGSPERHVLQTIFKTIPWQTPRSLSAFADGLDGCLKIESLSPSQTSTLWQMRYRLSQLEQDMKDNNLEAAWTLNYETHDLPLHRGLQEYLLQQEHDLLQSSLDLSLDQLRVIDKSPIGPASYEADSACDEPKLYPLNNATLLFDTAGTGKTTAILDSVRRNVGFYCVAPNLPPAQSSNTESVITPDRAYASQDTFTMWNDFKALESLDRISHAWENIMPFCHHEASRYKGKMTEPLLAARYRMLTLFERRIERPMPGDSNAMKADMLKWTLLQISCWSNNDPFDLAYRFTRLQTDAQSRKHISDGRKWNARKQSGPLWAFDEAQQALADSLAKQIMTEMLLANKSESYSLISGTSLKLKVMEDHLVQNEILLSDPTLDAHLIGGWVARPTAETMAMSKFLKDIPIYTDTSTAPSVTRHYSYISTIDQVQRLMEAHAWNILEEVFHLHHWAKDTNENGGAHLRPSLEQSPLLSRGGRALGFTIKLPPCKSWQDTQGRLKEWFIFRSSASSAQNRTRDQFQMRMKEHLTCFLGRVRWGALFAEELLKHTPETGVLTLGLARDATARTTDKIKKSLKARIGQLSNAPWIEDLYWTALTADISSTSMIFSKKSSADLISEGFALVHMSSTSSDADATDPVQGSLQEPLVVTAIMEHLRDPANGDLYESLVQRFFSSLQFDHAGGALGTMAEQVFATKLDRCLRGSTDPIAVHRRQQFMHVLQAAKANDSQTSAGAKIESLDQYYLVEPPTRRRLDSQTSLGAWFKNRTSCFLFPPQTTGPDLLFFLHIPETYSRILICIQFKTSAEDARDIAYVQKALYTLALKPWKQSGCDPKCPVIHLYVACGVAFDDEKFQACVETKQKDKAEDVKTLNDPSGVEVAGSRDTDTRSDREEAKEVDEHQTPENEKDKPAGKKQKLESLEAALKQAKKQYETAKQKVHQIEKMLQRESKQEEKAEDKLWDVEKMRENHYIWYMDKEKSKEVFGESFDRLLTLMKTNLKKNLKDKVNKESD